MTCKSLFLIVLYFRILLRRLNGIEHDKHDFVQKILLCLRPFSVSPLFKELCILCNK